MAGSSDEEEEIETVVVEINNLNIETTRTDDEVAERLEAALWIDIE